MNSKLSLSALETKAYKFIEKYVAKNGFSPTRQEIADGLGIKAKQAKSRVHLLLVNMQHKGYVKLQKAKWRNIKLRKAL
jgi:SOS-response transcriptional repressor LexA